MIFGLLFCMPLKINASHNFMQIVNKNIILLKGQPFSTLLTEVMFLLLQISLLSLILTIVILIIVMVRTVTLSSQVWVFLHLPQSELLFINNLLFHYCIYLHSCGTCLLWDRQVIEKSLPKVIQNEQLNILHPLQVFCCCCCCSIGYKQI